MGRFIAHPNKEVRERSIIKVKQHYEAMTGKNDIVLTWEIWGIPEQEEGYVNELRRRVRQERNLLSHIRPVDGESSAAIDRACFL